MIIIIDNLFCERNSKLIFKNLSFKLKNNTILQIVAGNGCGKTSLLRILCGLLHKKEGKIIIEKLYFNSLKNIFYLGTKQTLYKTLSPLENLMLFLSYNNNNYTNQDILKALKYFNLQNFTNIPCVELSTGQCQRVLLSQLFLTNAEFFLLDEPFLYLDECGILLVKKIIIEFVSNNKNIIISTHTVIKELRRHSIILHL